MTIIKMFEPVVFIIALIVSGPSVYYINRVHLELKNRLLVWIVFPFEYILLTILWFWIIGVVLLIGAVLIYAFLDIFSCILL